MYTINCNNTNLYYPGDRDSCISSTNLNLKVGDSGSFEFELPPVNPLFKTITERQMITILKDDEEYWRGDIREINTTFQNMKSIYCLEDLSFLGEVVKYAHSVTATYAQYFELLLDEYNLRVNEEKRFKKGFILKNTNIQTTFTFDTMSILEILRTIADDYYVRVRRQNGERYIDIVDLQTYSSGRVSNQLVQFGDNMMDFVKESNTSWMLSAILPVGAELDADLYEDIRARVTIESVNQGSKVLVNQAAVDKYGYIEKLVQFDDVLDPQELKDLASTYLIENSQPRLTMEIDAVDLSTITNTDAFNLGDLIHIICNPFGVDQVVSLCELTIDLLDPSKNSLTLSSAVERKSFTDIQNKISAEVNKMPSKSELLLAAQRNALQILQGVDGGFVTFVTNEKNQITELQISNNIDKDSATKKWVWNLGGLGYMEKIDGEWTIKDAMTMDGAIVADMITSGILQGIKIIADDGEIAGFKISSDAMRKNDAILSPFRIGCGTAGWGIINLVGNNQSGDSRYGYIQISNSGRWDSCLDGIRIYGNGKIVRYDGGGNEQWTKYLSNIP